MPFNPDDPFAELEIGGSDDKKPEAKPKAAPTSRPRAASARASATQPSSGFVPPPPTDMQSIAMMPPQQQMQVPPQPMPQGSINYGGVPVQQNMVPIQQPQQPVMQQPQQQPPMRPMAQPMGGAVAGGLGAPTPFVRGSLLNAHPQMPQRQPMPQQQAPMQSAPQRPPMQANPAGRPIPNVMQQPQVALQAADAILQKLGPLYGLLQGMAQQGGQSRDEAHKEGVHPVAAALNPNRIAASAAGMVHGPLDMVQNVLNSALAAPAHLPAFKFADQYSRTPGISQLQQQYPGAYGASSAGIQMGIPVPGISKIGSLAGKAAAGAGVGAAYGYTGSAGRQYADTGKVDQGEALKSTALGALIGGALPVVHARGMQAAGEVGAGARAGLAKLSSIAKPASPQPELQVSGKVMSKPEAAGEATPEPKAAQEAAPPASADTAVNPRKEAFKAKLGGKPSPEAEAAQPQAPSAGQTRAPGSWKNQEGIKSWAENPEDATKGNAEPPRGAPASPQGNDEVAPTKNPPAQNSEAAASVPAESVAAKEPNEANQTPAPESTRAPQPIPRLNPGDKVLHTASGRMGIISATPHDRYSTVSFNSAESPEVIHNRHLAPMQDSIDTGKLAESVKQGKAQDLYNRIQQSPQAQDLGAAYNLADRVGRNMDINSANNFGERLGQQRQAYEENIRQLHDRPGSTFADRQAQSHDLRNMRNQSVAEHLGELAPAPTEPKPGLRQLSDEAHNRYSEAHNAVNESHQKLMDEHDKLIAEYEAAATGARMARDRIARMFGLDTGGGDREPAVQRTERLLRERRGGQQAPEESQPVPPASQESGEVGQQPEVTNERRIEPIGHEAPEPIAGTNREVHRGVESGLSASDVPETYSGDTESAGRSPEESPRVVNPGEPTILQSGVHGHSLPVPDSAPAAIRSGYASMARASHELHRREADRAADAKIIEQKYGIAGGTKGVRNFDPKAQSEVIERLRQAVTDSGKVPEDSNLEVHPDRTYEGRPTLTGDESPQAALKVMKAHASALTKLRKNLVDAKSPIISDALEAHANGALPEIASVEHEGRKFAIRPIDDKLKAETTIANEQVETHAYQNIKDVLERVGNAAYNAFKPDGVFNANNVFGTTQRIAQFAKNAGVTLDARASQYLTKTGTNSDLYSWKAHPEFYDEYHQSMGELDLATRNTDRLATPEQRKDWVDGRYMEPHEIMNLQHLNNGQKVALIKQNHALNNLKDLMEAYSEVLSDQGYDGVGVKSLWGKNQVARYLKSDLRGIDPRRFGGSNWVEKMFKDATGGIYDMYVTGNWPIHELHAIEAVSVGGAYHPSAFLKAVKSVANPSARAFANSFDFSGGTMKALKDSSMHQTYEVHGKLIPGPGKMWQNLQRGTVNLAGKALGKQNAWDTLAKNKNMQLLGDVLEGSKVEAGKVGLLRMQSAHIVAEEMGYPGGGDALMADFDRLHPEKQLEAAAGIVYHLNRMIGYSPNGFKDLNVFGRIARLAPDGVGAILRPFAPFMTTKMQQSRVLNNFMIDAANAAGAGDAWTATKNIGKVGTMLGLIGLFGGRAAVPRDVQDGIRKLDPDAAKEWLEGADRMSLIGQMFDTQVEHVNPTLLPLMYVGESMPSQLVGALDDLVTNPSTDMVHHARNVAMIAALMHMGTVADRVGLNSILKLTRAGTQAATNGGTTTFAYPEDNTASSFIKGLQTFARAAAHASGQPWENPPDRKLGVTTTPKSVPQAMLDKLKPGPTQDEAHFVDRLRDDAAYGDAIARMDPKLYKNTKAHLSKLWKKYSRELQDGNPNASETLLGLDKFWEGHYHKYLDEQSKKEQSGTGNPEGAISG